MDPVAEGLRVEGQKITARLKTMINNDLKVILRAEGLQVSGNKSQLQQRLIDQVNDAVKNKNVTRLNVLKFRLSNGGASPPASYLNANLNPSTLVTPNAQPMGTMASNTTPRTVHGRGDTLPARQPRLIFRDSPFYEFRDVIIPSIELPAYPSNRHTIQKPIILNTQQAEKLRNPKYRVMLYSAQDMGLGHYSKFDVAFPQQLEVKVNDQDVKTNFKGLKNKPGSTRPADLTSYIRGSAGYQNILLVTYALTQKKFTFSVHLIKKQSADELTERIKTKTITRDRVIREMLAKKDDPDIEATSTVMSLKDPISTLRIRIPCRSSVCNHNQCFDANYFLQLQEQAPTWTCPICTKVVSFESLAVDQYFQELLDKTKDSIEQVTIEPDGMWAVTAANETKSKANDRNGHDDDDDDEDDDDLVEISDFRVNNIKAESQPVGTPQSLPSLAYTPPASLRDGSTPSVVAPRSAQKRKSDMVIDLTLSDDDEPPRPAKRATGPVVNGAGGALRNGSSSGGAGVASRGTTSSYTTPGLPNASNGIPQYPRASSISSNPGNYNFATLTNNSIRSATSYAANSAINAPNTSIPPPHSVSPFRITPLQHQAPPTRQHIPPPTPTQGHNSWNNPTSPVTATAIPQSYTLPPITQTNGTIPTTSVAGQQTSAIQPYPTWPPRDARTWRTN